MGDHNFALVLRRGEEGRKVFKVQVQLVGGIGGNVCVGTVVDLVAVNLDGLGLEG